MPGILRFIEDNSSLDRSMVLRAEESILAPDWGSLEGVNGSNTAINRNPLAGRIGITDSTTDVIEIPTFPNTMRNRRQWTRSSIGTDHILNSTSTIIQHPQELLTNYFSPIHTADPFRVPPRNDIHLSDYLLADTNPFFEPSNNLFGQGKILTRSRRESLDKSRMITRITLKKLVEANMLNCTTFDSTTLSDLLTSFFCIDKLKSNRINEFIECLPSLKKIRQFMKDPNVNEKENYKTLFFCRICLDIMEYYYQKYQSPLYSKRYTAFLITSIIFYKKLSEENYKQIYKDYSQMCASKHFKTASFALAEEVVEYYSDKRKDRTKLMEGLKTDNFIK